MRTWPSRNDSNCSPVLEDVVTATKSSGSLRRWMPPNLGMQKCRLTPFMKSSRRKAGGDDLPRNPEFIKLAEIYPELATKRTTALMNPVFASKETYERRFARFLKAFGNADYANLVQYIHTEKVCVATKRQLMSVIYHMRYVRGNPISMCLAVDIGRQLDGLEAVEARRPPAVPSTACSSTTSSSLSTTTPGRRTSRTVSRCSSVSAAEALR